MLAFAASSSYAMLMAEPSGYFSRMRSFAKFHLSKMSYRPSSASVLALSIKSRIWRPFSRSSTMRSLYRYRISPFLSCSCSKSRRFSPMSASCFLVWVSIAYVKILFYFCKCSSYSCSFFYSACVSLDFSTLTP